MRKIPTLFERDRNANGRPITETPNPECLWVFAGEGIATRKIDGTCCMIRDGALYKRHELKAGKTPPAGWEPAAEVEAETGNQPGWVPVGDGPEDAAHREGFEHVRPSLSALMDCDPVDGTYELIGPKVQGNPEYVSEHRLIAHGRDRVQYVRDDEMGIGVPGRTFADLKAFLEDYAMEGIVFHHEDGRAAKIKARDFGLPWPRMMTPPE